MEDRALPEGNCVGPDFFEIVTICVRVAQLDRALGYGPRCRGFESSHARLERRCKSISFFYISGNANTSLFSLDFQRYLFFIYGTIHLTKKEIRTFRYLLFIRRKDHYEEF